MKRQLKAYCVLKGNRDYRDVKGLVLFYEDSLFKISISNYPVSNVRCNQNILAIHIHEGNECIDNFESAKGHYNPNNCKHPYHAGDLGNIFINRDGSGFLSGKNDRFDLKDIIGKTIILHSQADDFKSQPNGNSGDRIACGVIKEKYRKLLND